MKKIIFLFILILIMLPSCDEEIAEEKAEQAVEQSEVTYILNTNSKKIHRSTCGTAKRISDENREDYYGDIEALFYEDYTTCKNCFRD